MSFCTSFLAFTLAATLPLVRGVFEANALHPVFLPLSKLQRGHAYALGSTINAILAAQTASIDSMLSKEIVLEQVFHPIHLTDLATLQASEPYKRNPSPRAMLYLIVSWLSIQVGIFQHVLQIGSKRSDVLLGIFVSQ